MLKALIKSRLSALFAMFFKTGKTKRTSSPAFKVLMGILAAYLVIMFFGMFTVIFISMTVLNNLGLSWLYFAFAGIAAFSLSFIGSVFAAQQQIYASTDNELLLSMPIPPRYIIASRIIMLIILNLGFELFVVLPAGIVWCVFCPVNPLGIIMYILCCLALAFLSVSISCALGWLITAVTNRIKNKSFVSVAISVVFFVFWFFVMSNINDYIDALVNNADKTAQTVKSALLPAYAFGTASAQGDIIGLLIFLACSLVPFAIIYALLSKSFIRLATDKRGFKKIKYKEKPLKVSSPFLAMLKKELRHFFSNGMYILNASFGSILLIVGAVLLIIYRDIPVQLLGELPILHRFTGAAGVIIICFMMSTNVISAPSVSLENKNLWISRSLPIHSGKMLLSKAACHFAVTLPAVLIGAVSYIIAVPVSLIDAVSTIVAPTVFTAFCALVGVAVNLQFPKSDYINETAVIKQSPSVIISMLVNIGALLIPVGVYIFAAALIPSFVFMFLFSLMLAAVCVLLCRYLTHGGAARLESL